MIYCVVPRPLAEELQPKLEAHYAGDDGVTVILDRRVADRRARQSRAGGAVDAATRERRTVRDRRRARVAGDTLPLAQP